MGPILLRDRSGHSQSLDPLSNQTRRWCACAWLLFADLEPYSRYCWQCDGRLIGVINKADGEMPSADELHTFRLLHPRVSVVFEEIHSPSLERYERLLSLPLSSKLAFLMALHPRLGAESPVRKLLEAEQPTQIARHIFSFLEFGGGLPLAAGHMYEVIRSVVLTHVQILQQWRASKKTEEHAKTISDSESGDGEDTTEKAPEDKNPSTSETTQEASKRRSKDESGSSPLWVFLRLPTDDIANTSRDGSVNTKLLKAVADLKKFPNGPRTGLVAKEQLLLTPYFPNHALLLLKYVAHRDASSSSSSKMTKKKVVSGLAPPSGSALPNERPPSSGSVPVPSFAPKFQISAEPAAAVAAASAPAAAAAA
eukprot:CAMPEP_0115185164 /NCGR_PEP_ID=MMETSP0270-20121206/9330_1 /TAXON_ID=71861 /ORGANISM="Scrippsiella trochoidea, Strain CCMP3099" /LENGTH=366 /DNA_ID=CAMNT_0002598259 /DNA_START=285 /DNA_END=1383 /DNA_ORIENTATION=+